MTRDTFIRQFGTHLNSQQLKAVCCTQKQILLLAVPGSGKTTVLTTRLGYMVLCRNIPPSNILTMTFSVAAAKEMRERFHKVYGDEAGEKITFCTINGLCSQIIHHMGHLIRTSPFQLIEETERKALLRELYLEITQEFPSVNDIISIGNDISYIKNMELSRDEIRETDFESEYIADIYVRYNQRLRNMKKMDYDDQMIYASSILNKYPDILSYYRNRYPYICVDEAQDTSKLQHRIIDLLTADTGNLFMVGDEDQSIYGFRGAYPEALLQFRLKYPEGTVLSLESNYRSKAPIVDAANTFISFNRSRYPKTLHATQGDGPPVELIRFKYRQQQYSYLLEILSQVHEDTAILYRNNDSAVPLVDLLDRNGIPFSCSSKKDVGFFTYQLVTDFQKIMRFASEPGNSDLFLQIYYKLGLGITKEAAVYACSESEHSGKTILAELACFQKFTPYRQNKIAKAERMIHDFSLQSPSAVLGQIWIDLDYKTFAQERKMDLWKYQILRSLAKQVNTTAAFLERMSQLSQLMSQHLTQRSGRIFLSTIHSSKGLEYPSVYILDAVDGILPQIPEKDCAPEDLGAYEEERRMFYVAMTRAKNHLYLMDYQDHHSSFVSEVQKHGKGTGIHQSGKPSSFPLPFHSKSEKYQECSAKPGEKIYHQKLGAGVIRSVKGDIVGIYIEQRRKVMYFSWSSLLRDHYINL